MKNYQRMSNVTFAPMEVWKQQKRVRKNVIRHI